MAEGIGIDSFASAGYVELATAGEPAAGEFHCSDCGYGVTVQHRLPSCPMCGGGAWEPSPWRAFTRRDLPPLQ